MVPHRSSRLHSRQWVTRTPHPWTPTLGTCPTRSRTTTLRSTTATHRTWTCPSRWCTTRCTRRSSSILNLTTSTIRPNHPLSITSPRWPLVMSVRLPAHSALSCSVFALGQSCLSSRLHVISACVHSSCHRHAPVIVLHHIMTPCTVSCFTTSALRSL